MRSILPFTAILILLQACANSQFGKSCTLPAQERQTALDNIRSFLMSAPDIDYASYIDPQLDILDEYNSSQHCSFVVQPHSPVATGFVWDGTLDIRIDKDTLLVDKVKRLNVQ